MKRTMLEAAAVALVLVLPDVASAGDGFRTYPSCGEYGGEDAHCIVGNGWGATFDARGEGREKYKLCVNPPNGSTSCRKNRTDRHGYDFDRLYTEFDTVGNYALTWKKGGHRLDTDRVYLGIGD